MKALVLGLVLGCGGAPARTSPPCPTDHPIGSIADYAAPVVPGFTIAAPQMCAHDEAYIRIERTTGTRTLGIGHGPTGAFDQGCMELPADPADRAQCPVINAGAILSAAYAELERRHVQVVGTGLGPCGDSNGDFGAWNMATAVYDWKHAAELVQVLTELLDRYDARGYVGAAVRGIGCVILI